MFGLSETEFQFLKENLIQPLKRKGAKVWIFGSRATGTHKKFSDVDIMVEGSEDYSSDISTIQEFFSKSSFPYKIDLVQLKDFAPSYKPNFEREKRSL